MAKRKSKAQPKPKAGRATDMERLRDAILAAALVHVAFDGWTAKALAAGARDAGAGPAGLARAFPGGPRDAARHFGAWADRRMTEGLGRQLRRKPMRTHERVAAAARARLHALAPHREAVRRLVAFLALPNNARLAPKLMWRAADAIWRAAGDASTDFNYYTKRALLSGVYGTTLMFWLTDESENFAATDAFLDRRIADVMKIFSLRARLKSAGDGIAFAKRVADAFGRLVPPGLARRWGQGFGRGRPPRAART
ncbi:MAG: COQ9 family protein [Rhodospirillales bacterium]|nr:COQ9 family protein [Rhodospirillales bacterium]